MSAAEVWVVTGASRGIGTEFVKQILSSDGHQVVAGARTPDTATVLQDLLRQYPGRLHIIPLDVASTTSIQDAARQVSQLQGISGVDYLINNAAVSDPGQSRLQ